VSAGLSPDHRRLLLHVLDLEDAEELVAQVKTRYEAPLLEIFACSPT
jgi:multicomponent K+:H+ antiporter subunit E